MAVKIIYSIITTKHSNELIVNISNRIYCKSYFTNGKCVYL